MSTSVDEVWIDVAAPEYRGAPYPSFDEKCINEFKFEDGLRYKTYEAVIRDGTGHIEWLSQEEDHSTSAWDDEIARAFKANGLKAGSLISVRFGSRDTGVIDEYDITVS